MSPGLHPQSRRKGERRATDMSRPAEEPGPEWFRPPPEEWDEPSVYTFTPEGADPAKHRIKVRIVSHIDTSEFVEFALIQQVLERGRWRDVAAADSCHDIDVHLHRYSRATGERVGDPEQIMHLASGNDLYEGYDLAYVRLVDEWAENHRRWERA